MNVVVIGSEGFLGSHIAAHYAREGNEVRGIDLRRGDGAGYQTHTVPSFSYSLTSILSGFAPDLCIFAGGSANVQLSVDQPHLDFAANVESVSRILESLKNRHPACKFLHISSAAVYGSPEKLPVTEEAPKQPLSPYGWHKLQAEILCQEYHSSYGLATCSLRPFSVYGPGQKKLLFWDLYQKLLTPSANVSLYGTGKETRDFIYIRDFVSALDVVVRKGIFDGRAYNVASGIEVRVEKAAELFAQKLGIQKNILFNMIQRKGDPAHWKADLSQLKRLGFVPATDLGKGLQEYILWLAEKK